MPEVPSRLLQIVLEVTYRCTNDCLFCYNCWKNGYPVDRELAPSEFEQVLSRLPRCGQIALSGGEPLLRKDILEIVKAARNRADKVSILTTGEFLSPALAEEFRKQEVFIQIPLHGTEKTHEKLTRRKGSYRKALDAMALLSKMDMKFGASVVLCRENAGEFPVILDIMAAMGASETIAIRFLPGGEGMKHQDQMPSAKQVKSMYDCLENASRKYGLRPAIGVPNLPCVIDEKPYRRVLFNGCGAGIDWFTVDPSGRLRLCNHSPTIIGDLKTQSFGDMWELPVVRKMRKLEYIPDECAKCKLKAQCRGGCRAVGETLCGSLKAPDPLFSYR